jgi:hypothetical protein
MSRFLCICGAVFRDEEEPPGASCVAYPLDELVAIESRIAKYVADFATARDQTAREAWLKGHFHEGYLTDGTDREVIEDIVIRELDDGFVAMFRCPLAIEPRCTILAARHGPSIDLSHERPRANKAIQRTRSAGR